MIIDQAKLDELKVLAEAATPGKFGLAECHSSGDDAWLTLHLEEAEAKYVIAFTPPVVLSLIAELERLRADLKLEEQSNGSNRSKIEELRAELASEANHKEARQILANDLDALSHGGHVTTALGAAVEERIRAARELKQAERAVVDAAVAYYSSIEANDSPHVDRLEGNVAICANEGCLLDATDKLLALRAKKAGT